MNASDIARRVLPKDLYSPLRRWLSARIPLETRMGKQYWSLRAFLQEAQWWDRAAIEHWQLNRLREIVQYAYDNVPGYQTLYKEANVKPEDIMSLDDVRRLPFTTKELLRDNVDDFTSRIIPASQRKYVTTGGSTGTPFGFYHTQTNVWMENAFIHSSWSWIGWDIKHTVAVLRGAFSGSRTAVAEYDEAYRQLLLSSYHLSSETYSQYRNAILRHEPKHLHAYPATATLLADLVLEHDDVGKIVFDSVLLGSENVYTWQSEKLKLAFPDARVHAWYGHTEQAILAPTCEHSNEYHAWPFYGLTETEGNEDKDSPEAASELIGTSFWSTATPLIRYRTGDLAVKAGKICPYCRRQFDIISRIEGRKQDYIVAADGTYITLTGLIFAQHFHAFGQIKNMQLYQEKPGEVVVRIVPRGEFSEENSREIETTMAAAVGSGLVPRVQIVDEIPRTQRGKYRFLEQMLDIRYKE